MMDWVCCVLCDWVCVLCCWVDLIDVDVVNMVLFEVVCFICLLCDVVVWDVLFIVEGLCFFVEYVDKFGGDVVVMWYDNFGMVVVELYGVVGVIMLWNFLMVMVLWKVGVVLVVGNVVVFKLFELMLYLVIWLVELVIEVGVLLGFFNVVQGDGCIMGDVFMWYLLIFKMIFIGLICIGVVIMVICVLYGLKFVMLELGGKSLQFVFVDVFDIDWVVVIVVGVIIGNVGQVCVVGLCLIV